jgi:copper chaperone CopZ
MTPVSDSNDAAEDPDRTGPTSVAHLSIDGMHCGSCVELIEETLEEQPGVAKASVDLESTRAVVEYDPSQLDVDEIRAAIAEAGYSATPVS